MEINCFDDFTKSPKMRTVFSRKNFQMAGKIPNGNKLLRRLRKKPKNEDCNFTKKNFQLAEKYQMEMIARLS